MQQTKIREYQLPIFKTHQSSQEYLEEGQLQMTLQQLCESIQKKYGHSPYVTLYQHQLDPFNGLPFVSSTAPIKDILQEYPGVLLTHHNPQFIEQNKHLIGRNQKAEGVPWVFVIVQICHQTYFHHETFKLSLDCKIFFLASLASRYGRSPSILYFDFKVPLHFFSDNQTISSCLLQLSFLEQHLIIIVDRQEQEQRYYKTVRNPSIIDRQRYYALAMQGRECFMVVDRRVNWRTMETILELIFQNKMQAKDQQGKNYPIRSLGQVLDERSMTLQKKESSRQLLPKTLTKSMFIGTTDEFLCFVQKSSLLHLFSLSPPYNHINTSLLHSKEDEQLQQDLPILHSSTLIMYNITRTAIVLKHYPLPQASLTTTKHFRWRSDEYGGIECQSLDLLVVNLKSKPLKRLFFVEDPNHYLDVEVKSKKEKIWLAKQGTNSHTDHSGIFAYEHSDISQVEVFDLKKQAKVDSLELPQLTHLAFHTPTHRLIAQLQTTCIEYNYQRKWIIHQLCLSPNELLYYSPKGNHLIITTKYIKSNPKDEEAQTIGNCLLKEQSVFFAKDPPFRLHSYNYIHEVCPKDPIENTLN